MRSLSNFDLITLWERGSSMHVFDRALLALSMAFPEASPRIADWALGRRNQALLELHCSLFGTALQAWSVCAGCGEKMEFTIHANAFLQQNTCNIREEPAISVNGHNFRLPTSRDLAVLAQLTDTDAGALKLMELCSVNSGNGERWTQAEIDQAGEMMAAADPLAEIRVALSCPACSHDTVETVEVTSFLWSEIEGGAKRLLWDVHAIASAYGWTESEVLALSPARRARYAEMAQA
jgi:hypothetical protein